MTKKKKRFCWDENRGGWERCSCPWWMITISQVAACICKLWVMNEGPEDPAEPAHVNEAV